MNSTELLKDIEERDMKPRDDADNLPLGHDFDHVQKLIDLRKQKLASIKPFIALKTYNIIADKIEREEQELHDAANRKKAETARLNQKQSLPREYFELAYLKPKIIRID
ncbi:hypothetical protein KGQ24_02850 [Patescibacteria group bacterium]|nr:hypothetical protein [Patescibacteria group bacterium]